METLCKLEEDKLERRFQWDGLEVCLRYSPKGEPAIRLAGLEGEER